MSEEPKPISPVMIGLSVVVTLFLLWTTFTADEAPSSTLFWLTWILIAANVVFIVAALSRRR